MKPTIKNGNKTVSNTVPNLNRACQYTSASIEVLSHALSTEDNIIYVTKMSRKDITKYVPMLDEFVYSEELLNETLHHLQAARKNLLLLGVKLGAEENSKEVSTD
jgi:hypothetical protein